MMHVKCKNDAGPGNLLLTLKLKKKKNKKTELTNITSWSLILCGV